MLKGYLSNKRKPPVELDSRLFSLYIVQSSTLEAIAVWGLMLGILGGSIYIVIVFFIVAVAGLIITFPTRNRWERLSVRIKPETGENNS
jgi:cytochrome c oxidase subunit IV